MGFKPRPKHRLRPIKVNLPNLPAWDVWFCDDCNEAYVQRLINPSFMTASLRPICPTQEASYGI